MVSRRAVLLLASPASYRLAVFKSAALASHLIPIAGVLDPVAPISDTANNLSINSSDIPGTLAKLDQLKSAFAELRVIAVDDIAVELAALMTDHLGQVANSADAALASRNKIVMRQRFAAAALPGPTSLPFDPTNSEPCPLSFPVVIKPASLNGSRGVIRADDPTSFAIACQRLTSILRDEGIEPGDASALVETFIPGGEVAIEAVMTDGSLAVLAVFDKPDPLDGPFFEETIYVTPSRYPIATQHQIADTVELMANAIGLRHGPVHAEVRINEDGVWPIEIASRSIGGMCSSVLEFGAGMGLEELILRHAFGDSVTGHSMTGAAGAMMIPIPASGILRSAGGIDASLAIPGITGVDITAKLNHPIQTLPEGSSYLGFIFARADDPALVEQALREAHACLEIEISPMLRLATQ
jgi:biotin carboxylase